MNTITLLPAYGRDYKSAIAARIDLANGKDFLINDVGSRWDGNPANLPDLRQAGYTHVQVRYANRTRCTLIDISKNIE